MDRFMRGLRPLVWTALYFAGGKLGLSLASVNASVSLVWPPTGIAIACFLLCGVEATGVVWVGAFLVNLTTTWHAPSSAAIAVGNTCEAWVAWRLVTRYCGGAAAFERPRDYFGFVFLAALLSTVLSATIGTFAICVLEHAPWMSFGALWSTWWAGDAVGALIMAPLLILWMRRPRMPARATELEAAILLAVLTAVSVSLLGGHIGPLGSAPLQFMSLPVLAWTAFRFGPRETATFSFLLCAAAVRGVLQGMGPFVRPHPEESLLLLQVYMGTINVMSLALAAAVLERSEAEENLQQIRQDLELRVQRRTADLSAALQALQAAKAETDAANAELKAANEAKNRFLASMSHELRTPLNAIIGFSDVIAMQFEKQPNPAIASHLGYIRSAGHDLILLINDMLDLARIEAGRMELLMEDFDLSVAIRAAIGIVAPMADRKQQALHFPEGGLGQLRADAARFRQILFNLLSNAVKFTPNGGEICVEVERGERQVRIIVSDTGVGISAEEIGHVFEAFRQSSRTGLDDPQGTGLGLTIARQLAQAHGGALRVASTPGRGSRFTLTLPNGAS